MFLKLKAQPIEGTSFRENSPITAYSTCREVRDILQTIFLKTGKKANNKGSLLSTPPPFFNTKKKKKIKCQILHNTAIWYSLYGNLQLINNNSKNRAVCLVSSSYELDNKECRAPHYQDSCVAIEILHDYLHNSSNLYYVTLSSSLFAFFSLSLSLFYNFLLVSSVWYTTCK